jgi:hypothetical protein
MSKIHDSAKSIARNSIASLALVAHRHSNELIESRKINYGQRINEERPTVERTCSCEAQCQAIFESRDSRKPTPYAGVICPIAMTWLLLSDRQRKLGDRALELGGNDGNDLRQVAAKEMPARQDFKRDAASRAKTPLRKTRAREQLVFHGAEDGHGAGQDALGRRPIALGGRNVRSQQGQCQALHPGSFLTDATIQLGDKLLIGQVMDECLHILSRRTRRANEHVEGRPIPLSQKTRSLEGDQTAHAVPKECEWKVGRRHERARKGLGQGLHMRDGSLGKPEPAAGVVYADDIDRGRLMLPPQVISLALRTGRRKAENAYAPLMRLVFVRAPSHVRTCCMPPLNDPDTA